jgi:hypothetical protein
MRTASLRNETIEPTTTRMGQMAASVDYRRARTSTQSSSAKTSSTQSPAPPTASANSLAVQTKNQRFPRGMSSAHPVTPLILTDALMGAPDLATRASSPSAIAAWLRGRWIKEALPTRHQKKLMPVAVTAARAYRCCSSRRTNDGLTIWPACNCRSRLGAGHIRVEKPACDGAVIDALCSSPVDHGRDAVTPVAECDASIYSERQRRYSSVRSA